MGIQIPLLLLKFVLGNCLPGVLAVGWSIVEGKKETRIMLSTLTNWKTSLQWYFIAVALPSAVFFLALDAVLVWLPLERLPLSASRLVSTFLLSLPLGPLWEELAWRAFALRRLEARYSRIVSALILGVYWALWHVPLWIIILNPGQASMIPILIAASFNLVAWSIIWAYLYHESSESLPVVILMHGTYGAVWSEVFALAPVAQLIYVSAAISGCMALVFSRKLRNIS
jgi:membrane protease YdiL (CAAX protease family)